MAGCLKLFIMEPSTHFQFTYNLSLIDAERTISGGQELYTLHFSNEIPTVTLSAVRREDGSYNWDTVPPGNTELAASLGTLIEQYNREQDGKDTAIKNE